MLDETAIADLARDIEDHGLQHHIMLEATGGPTNDGPRVYRVIDGRNRLAALERLGLVINATNLLQTTFRDGPIFTPTTFANDGEVASFVISANVRRRHLTKEQQADLIVAAINATANTTRTSETGPLTDLASVATSVKRGPKGRLAGREKDPTKARILAETKKLDIGARTAERAIAKRKGKTPAARKPSSTRRGDIGAAIRDGIDRFVTDYHAKKSTAAQQTAPEIPPAQSANTRKPKTNDKRAHGLLDEIDQIKVDSLSDPQAFGNALIQRGKDFVARAKAAVH